MSEGLICPLLVKKCIEHRCKFWLHEEYINTKTGEKKQGFECLFILQHIATRQGTVENIRTQAGLDKVATAITMRRALTE